jgi:hypothetical protein
MSTTPPYQLSYSFNWVMFRVIGKQKDEDESLRAIFKEFFQHLSMVVKKRFTQYWIVLVESPGIADVSGQVMPSATRSTACSCGHSAPHGNGVFYLIARVPWLLGLK